MAASVKGGAKIKDGNIKLNACAKGALGVGASLCGNVAIPTKPIVNVAKKGAKEAGKIA